jgi:hypothetical protein
MTTAFVIRGWLRAAEGLLALTIAHAVTRLRPSRFAAIGHASIAMPAGPSAATTDPRAAAVGVAVAQAAARLPWTVTCLPRAVAGQLMLWRRGMRSALVIGVRKEHHALRAHAWVEYGGGYVCGGPADDYRPLVAFRSSPFA